MAINMPTNRLNGFHDFPWDSDDTYCIGRFGQCKNGQEWIASLWNPCLPISFDPWEKHKEIIGKSWEIIGQSCEHHRKIIRFLFKAFVGNCWHFYCHFVEIIDSKAPGNYFASIWTYNFLICLWEGLKLLISMTSTFLDVSPAPKSNIIYLWRHQDTTKKIKNNPGIIFTNNICINLRIWEIQRCQFWTRRAPEIPADPFNKILKNLDEGPTSSWKHEMKFC